MAGGFPLTLSSQIRLSIQTANELCILISRACQEQPPCHSQRGHSINEKRSQCVFHWLTIPCL
ncbi:hypothetical protein B0H34DRAFT_702414 [Crassisporium funariophilum]|nr:hypothetical protein B0H34DRAFT_702414 [Crassisporium funariophilum]